MLQKIHDLIFFCNEQTCDETKVMKKLNIVIFMGRKLGSKMVVVCHMFMIYLMPMDQNKAG